MPVTVNKDLCIGCGACEENCPVQAIALGADGKAECDKSKCIDCLSCVGNCPVQAITQD